MVKKLGQALTDDIGIAAYVHKICVPIPSRDEMNVEMVGQTCARASAEIHTDIEAVWFYRQGEGLLRFSNEFHQLQQFFIGSLVKVGDVPDGCYE